MRAVPAPHTNSHKPCLVPGSEDWCRRVHVVCALIAVIVGLTNLAVWAGPARWLALVPGVMVVRINSAICITGAGLSLLCWYYGDRVRLLKPFAPLLGWGTAILAGVTAAGDIFAFDAGIDQLFGPGTFDGDQAHQYVVRPGRMSLNAALSECLLGLAVANLDRRVRLGKFAEVHLAPLFALGAALPATSGLVGYLVGAGGFTRILHSANILLHAAVALLALVVGVLAARPERRPTSAILSSGADGILLRRLLPGASLLLIAMGWLISSARMAGSIGAGEGTALMLYGGLVLLSVLIFGAARTVACEEAAAVKATAARREGESRFRVLADNISQLAWMTDGKGRIAWVNQRWTDYTGLTMERIEEEGWEQLLDPNDRDRVCRRLTHCFSDGADWEDIFTMRGVNGEYRWFLSRAMPIQDEQGNVQRWFGTNTDVTEQLQLSNELARAKERAERASQAKDDFLAALSHELRTPLTPVLLTVEALANDARIPCDAREELRRMERYIALEGRLIDDLLDLTRISRGKFQLRREACDVNALMTNTLAMVKGDAEARGVAIESSLEAEASELSGDPARLQQVFWNVLKNAVKFTSSGGRISVKSWNPQGTETIVFQISDTGLGFPPEAADRLFQPFQQEKLTAEHRFGGLGLGLAISRAITEAHGGRISGKSPGVGKGATFTIELPGAFRPERAEPAEPTSNGKTAGVPKPVNVVLVEDHEPTLQVLSRLFTKHGYVVRTADSVSAARKVLSEGQCDLLVSDLGLPDGTGIGVMHFARERFPSLHGIVLSGYGMESDLERTKAAGFDAHLIKPIDFAEILRVLRRIQSPASKVSSDPHPPELAAQA